MIKLSVQVSYKKQFILGIFLVIVLLLMIEGVFQIIWNYDDSLCGYEVKSAYFKRVASHEKIKELCSDDENFEYDVLNSSMLTLVDFWAEWCGPCIQISPLLEEIANENKDIVKVIKLKVDENRETAGKYYIMGIPSLFSFLSRNYNNILIKQFQKFDNSIDIIKFILIYKCKKKT